MSEDQPKKLLLEISYTLDRIEEVSIKLSKLLPVNGMVFLEGPMGSGKTTLTRAILKQLGVIDSVNSPTFSIINTYHTNSSKTVFHADLYRIENEDQLFQIGFEDYMNPDNLLFIEWPDRLKTLKPNNYHQIKLTTTDDQTRVLRLYSF
jgi:tRNA threonylcarbamoyladenosine biosynthesis protein TsaE